MLELRIRADKSEERPVAEDGSPGRWPIGSVELVGKAPKTHNFSDTFVARATRDGYLSFENPQVVMTEGYSRNPVVTGTAIVLALAGDLVYDVVEHPGRYADPDERETHEYRCTLRRKG